jgi:diacylglycerol kinase family enzyme
LADAVRKFIRFKLYTFTFSTAGKQTINTAASGCMILEQSRGSFAARLISHDHTFSDGMISLVISAPISIVAYAKLLQQALRSSKGYRKLPGSIGYIKSPQIDIEAETPFEVIIDDENRTHTSLREDSRINGIYLNSSDYYSAGSMVQVYMELTVVR